MRKNQKVSKSEVKEVNVSDVVAEINATKHNFFDNVNFFQEEVKEVNNIVIVDMSTITKVDVMKMSRVAFFRKLVKLDTNFNNITIYDYRFYANTNDRSKTRHSDKYQDEKLNNDYVRMRTAKQLRDVLREKDIVTYLNKKYSQDKSFFTVSEYKQFVK